MWMIGLCPETAYAPPNTITRLNSLTSTRNNSITTALISKAFKDLELHKEEK
jgi:hypothetical protein